MQNLKLIRALGWEEVFLFWYQTEGWQSSWKNLAKERGYASWADWRITEYINHFDCIDDEWNLYELEVANGIFDFYGGPFRSWIEKYYAGKISEKLVDLIEHPDIKNDKMVRAIVDNYPVDSVIICLEVDGKIVVIEGMHRSCALATMTKEGKKLPEKLLFAVGKSKLKELPVVGRSSKK